MPQNLTSADKARLAHEARRRAAQKQRSSGGARTRPSRPIRGSGASANVEEVATTSAIDHSPAPELSATYVESDASAEAEADALCEIAVSNPSALGSFAPTVRTLCRNRRRLIATHGKKGVAKTRHAASSSSNAMLSSKLLDENSNSRDYARSRRSAISMMGRGNKPKSRPSRPLRPKIAPPKVEIGTTLSGSTVSGTQVERTNSVTGNESGTCRSVTGTEYVGNEQFSTFCETKPAQPIPKVGMSMTASGSPVSGTGVGHSVKVSGDEHGACQAITGSEYLGSEQFAAFCNNEGLTKPVQKVIAGKTQVRQMTVTGSDDFRQNGTTGLEIGADKTITGSQYTNSSPMDLSNYSSSRGSLPNRMEKPETSNGSSVTGDEHSSYDAITGSDYSFDSPSFSYGRAEREAIPQKVGVDASCSGQRITGNLVGRSNKVTGNEHGSDRHLTGSQYGRNSCTQPSKMPSTHAFAGGRLTGNRAAHDPKINSDGLSGCQPVTGTEMHGLEPLADHCSSTQMPVSAGFDNTPQMTAPLPAVESHAHDFTRAVPQQFTAPAASSSYDRQQPVNQTANTASTASARNSHDVSGGYEQRQPVRQQPVYEQLQQQQSAPQVQTCDTPANAEPQGGACCDHCAAKQLAEQAGLLNSTHVQSNPTPPAPAPAPVINEPPPVMEHVAPPAPVAPTYVAAQHMGHAGQHMAQHAAGQHVAAHNEGMVTGPSNMGMGLLSGTPEARYPQQMVQSTANVPLYHHGHQGHQHSHVPTPSMHVAPQAQYVAPQPQTLQPQYVPPQPQYVQQYAYPNPQPVETQTPQVETQAPQDVSSKRITGEGRDDGLPITGDNWGRGDGVTGTEGRWAQSRNPTLQMDSRTMVPGAHSNKGMERAVTSHPTAAITGSSGSSDTGAQVTLSGGARG